MSDFPAETFATIFTVLAAPCMASFGMLMGDRWIEDRPTLDYLRSISVEPSHCDNCNTKISGIALLPVIGWLSSLGRCSSCKTKIPLILFVAECVALLFGVLLVSLYGEQAIFFLPAIAGLCAASRSDWRIREIHESSPLLILLTGILLAWGDNQWAEHFIAFAAMTTPLIIILPIYAALGRIPVIPMGDIYLTAAISFTLTPDMLLTFIASLIAAGFAVRYAVGPEDEAEHALPMAPILAAAWAAAQIIPMRF